MKCSVRTVVQPVCYITNYDRDISINHRSIVHSSLFICITVSSIALLTQCLSTIDLSSHTLCGHCISTIALSSQTLCVNVSLPAPHRAIFVTLSLPSPYRDVPFLSPCLYHRFIEPFSFCHCVSSIDLSCHTFVSLCLYYRVIEPVSHPLLFVSQCLYHRLIQAKRPPARPPTPTPASFHLCHSVLAPPHRARSPGISSFPFFATWLSYSFFHLQQHVSIIILS